MDSSLPYRQFIPSFKRHYLALIEVALSAVFDALSSLNNVFLIPFFRNIFK